MTPSALVDPLRAAPHRVRQFRRSGWTRQDRVESSASVTVRSAWIGTRVIDRDPSGGASVPAGAAREPPGQPGGPGAQACGGRRSVRAGSGRRRRAPRRGPGAAAGGRGRSALVRIADAAWNSGPPTAFWYAHAG